MTPYKPTSSVRNLLLKFQGIWPLSAIAYQIRIRLWNMPSTKRKEWLSRIRDVMQCPDRLLIPLVPEAGKITDGSLVMFNGVKVAPLGYYGYPTLRMLRASGGIHEPQEERVFAELLKVLPNGATMLELGSYWAFYSLSFLKQIPSGTSYCIEPTEEGLASGQANFERNGFRGHFTKAYIGSQDGQAPDGVSVTSVDSFLEQMKIDFLDILHSDIQGFELEMLRGAEKAFIARTIGYVFISTHSNELHQQCVEWLGARGYEILHSIDLDDTYSHDGLVVAKSPSAPDLAAIRLSRKKSDPCRA